MRRRVLFLRPSNPLEIIPDGDASRKFPRERTRLGGTGRVEDSLDVAQPDLLTSGMTAARLCLVLLVPAFLPSFLNFASAQNLSGVPVKIQITPVQDSGG